VQAPHHRDDLLGGRAGPVGEDLAADLDPLPGQDLRLPVEGQVVGVARHQDMRDRRLGRHAALDQAGRRGHLQHDAARAGPAGQLRPLGHDHAELGRDHVQPLSRINADLDQRALAARAGRRLGREHQLDARQVRRQAPTAGPTPFGLLPAQLRRALAGLGLVGSERRLGLLEGEQQLVFGQPLRSAPELHPLELRQQMLQPLVLRCQRVALARKAVALGGERVAGLPGRQEQRAQRGGIVRQCRRVVARGGAHHASDSTQVPPAWESSA
jgi:hypothetical protein